MHSIKQFCDKIDSIKLMADNLRKTPPSDKNIQNKIEVIQSDCLLVAKGKVDKEFFTNIKDYEENNYDYSGVDHPSGLSINEDE
tara:strand:+ start:1142 stop:1393 length:252 start_codon:yes stop_codon:yes gene_type:complete